MIMVTVSDVASMIEVSCDPMMVPTTPARPTASSW